jgi:precorrin-2 dehydrogenase/sirohydrochlorin ferrochelatase
LADLAAQGRIFHLDREYLPGDLTGAMLAFAATDDRLVNAAVATEARSRNILVDVTDAPETGTFTSPAMLIQGDLLITVSTAGKSPALARRIRDELKGRVGPEHATALTILGALREKLLTAAGSSAYNKRLLNDLVDRDLPVLLREKSREDIDRLLTETFGTGFTLAELGVGEKDPA